MDERRFRKKHLDEIVEKSRFWDVDDLIRNFDREMAHIEQGLGHMVWDTDEHRVTTHLSLLPMTPRFQVSENDKEFRLVVKLPGVSKNGIRLRINRNTIELFACTGETVCRPYYMSVDASGELVPDSADAGLTEDVFKVTVAKVKKKKVRIK